MIFPRRAAGARVQHPQKYFVRLIAKLSVALILSLVMLVLAAMRRIVRSVVRPKTTADVKIISADVAAQTITLLESPVTSLSGRYGLLTTGSTGYLRLGSVLSRDEGSVTRKLLTEVSPDAVFQEEASFSGWYYDHPDQLHLPYYSALVPTGIGPAPAWIFPANSAHLSEDIWVIQVHGWGSKRAECLRAVPVFNRLGFTTMIASYRNDGDAPRSSKGSSTLGLQEWRDIDAAISFAKRSGASSVLLMGWSMGGAVVLQTLLRSAHADFISAVILDSPVIDWPMVLNSQALKNGIPKPLSDLSMSALSSPFAEALTGIAEPVSFAELDVLGRSDLLRHPILILHSCDDSFVPDAASRLLAAQRDDLVDLVSFAGAAHTKIWNFDQQGWERAISSWLSKLFVARSS